VRCRDPRLERLAAEVLHSSTAPGTMSKTRTIACRITGHITLPASRRHLVAPWNSADLTTAKLIYSKARRLGQSRLRFFGV
jgi:hypothetical protein